jgi:hypothetical protein
MRNCFEIAYFLVRFFYLSIVGFLKPLIGFSSPPPAREELEPKTNSIKTMPIIDCSTNAITFVLEADLGGRTMTPPRSSLHKAGTEGKVTIYHLLELQALVIPTASAIGSCKKFGVGFIGMSICIIIGLVIGYGSSKNLLRNRFG